MAPPELLWTIYEKMGIEGLVTGYCMTETHLYGTNTSIQNAGVQYVLSSLIPSLEQSPARQFTYVRRHGAA